jgi:hypothetical protein
MGACNYLVLNTASWNPCIWSDGFGDALIVWPFFPSILLHVLFYVHLLVKILLTKKSSIKTYSKGSTRGWDKRDEVGPQHKALLKILYGTYRLGGGGGFAWVQVGIVYRIYLCWGEFNIAHLSNIKAALCGHQFRHKHVKLCPWIPNAQTVIGNRHVGLSFWPCDNLCQ